MQFNDIPSEILIYLGEFLFAADIVNLALTSHCILKKLSNCRISEMYGEGGIDDLIKLFPSVKILKLVVKEKIFCKKILTYLKCLNPKDLLRFHC